MSIDCCYGCVPPKRTPTCKFYGTCCKYAEAKKKHDEEKAAVDKKKLIEQGLNSQYASGVLKSIKNKRQKGGVKNA